MSTEELFEIKKSDKYDVFVHLQVKMQARLKR